MTQNSVRLQALTSVLWLPLVSCTGIMGSLLTKVRESKYLVGVYGIKYVGLRWSTPIFTK